jgi:hypothetical protein
VKYRKEGVGDLNQHPRNDRISHSDLENVPPFKFTPEGHFYLLDLLFGCSGRNKRSTLQIENSNLMQIKFVLLIEWLILCERSNTQ